MMALIASCLLLLAYTYFGYPIAIGVLARVAPLRRTDADANEVALPEITVCLPVFNGSAFLPRKLESLLGQDYPADRLKILVYCDGCTDDSEAVARRIAAAPTSQGRIQVVASAARLGKPTALNQLRTLATGELLLLNDVRQPLSPNAARALAAPFRSPEVGCTTGNLVLQGGAGSGVYWRYENWIRRQESRFRSVVGMSGAIAMLRRAELPALPADLILDDVFIPMVLRLRGRRILFIAEAQAHDAAFDDEQEFGRKVRTLAGNYQLFGLLPALLLPFVNPSWFETVSHKVMRLVAPWLMIVLAVATGVVACGDGPAALVGGVLLGLQLMFYGGALLGRRAGRFAAIARTFVVLNAAALLGLWRHVTRRQRVTW